MFGRDPEFEAWLDAAHRGDTTFVLGRLRQGMDVDAGRERTSTTALMAAASAHQIEMIRLLLDQGADPNLENSLGYTAVTCAIHRSRPAVCRNGVFEPCPLALRMLLAAGGALRLREAVLLNDVELARRRLDEGADVDTGRGTYHGSLLQVAATHGRKEIVKLLLDRGAETEATDDLGQTPLTAAASSGETEMVEILLDAGANIDALDWFSRSALANAASEGHQDTVARLLARSPRRGLIDALYLNEMPLFKTLVEEKVRSGWSVDSEVGCLRRLAMEAACAGNPEALRILLQRGASHYLEANRNSSPKDERPLLAEAARFGHVETVSFLLNHGADIHGSGKDGLTPLVWASNANHEEVVKLLRSSGAER